MSFPGGLGLSFDGVGTRVEIVRIDSAVPLAHSLECCCSRGTARQIFTREVIEQSGSGNVAVKSEVIPNCCESSSSTKIQNIATVTAVTVQRSRTR